MKYKRGETVHVWERDIDRRFKAIIVYDDCEDMYFARPLDGYTFDHHLFREEGLCVFCDEDVIEPFTLDEELFTL